MDKTLSFLVFVIGLLLANEPSRVGAEEKKGAGGEAGKTAGAKPQQTLTITTIYQDPFTMQRGSELEGYSIELMTDLAQTLGFGFKMALVKDGKYGFIDTAGNWTGMIGEIVRKEADLAMAPLTITSNREEVVDFTVPFMHTGISFIMKKEGNAAAPSILSTFLMPFSAETWVGLLVAYVVTCLCLYIAARLSPCEWVGPPNEEKKFTFLNSLWFGAGALTLQGAEPHPKSVSARIIAVVWWIFTIILLAAYIAGFSVLLNAGNKPTTMAIQTFEDLANQKELEFGTIESSSTYNFFKNAKNPIYQIIYAYIEKNKDRVMTKTVQEGLARVQSSNYAFIGEAAMLDLFVSNNCSLVRAPAITGTRAYGIAAPRDSPWIKPLSIAILKMSENSHLSSLRDKWWGAGPCPHKSSSGHSPVQPQALSGVFLILAIGLGLGVIVALLELVCKARSRAADEKKPCCSAFTEEIGRRFRSQEEENPENPEKLQA